MSNIDFLEEVHYDRFGREIVSASRGKRDTTSSGPDLVEEITNTRVNHVIYSKAMDCNKAGSSE